MLCGVLGYVISAINGFLEIKGRYQHTISSGAKKRLDEELIAVLKKPTGLILTIPFFGLYLQLMEGNATSISPFGENIVSWSISIVLIILLTIFMIKGELLKD